MASGKPRYRYYDMLRFLDDVMENVTITCADDDKYELYIAFSVQNTNI